MSQDQSVVDAVTDRVKSPFFGTYTLLLAVLNWKFFVILFHTDVALQDRLEALSEYLAASCWTLLTAFVLTSAYIFTKPWVNGWISEYYRRMDFKEFERKRLHEVNRKFLLEYGTSVSGLMGTTLKEIKGALYELTQTKQIVTEISMRDQLIKSETVGEVKGHVEKTLQRLSVLHDRYGSYFSSFEFNNAYFEELSAKASRSILRPVRRDSREGSK